MRFIARGRGERRNAAAQARWQHVGSFVGNTPHVVELK